MIRYRTGIALAFALIFAAMAIAASVRGVATSDCKDSALRSAVDAHLGSELYMPGISKPNLIEQKEKIEKLRNTWVIDNCLRKLWIELLDEYAVSNDRMLRDFEQSRRIKMWGEKLMLPTLNGKWRGMSSAPRDGTVIEIINISAIPPWRGLHHWTQDGKMMDEKGNILPNKMRTPAWVNANPSETTYVSRDSEHYFLWRSYSGSLEDYGKERSQ